MSYVDGFLLSVPKDKLEDYRKICNDAAKVWVEHGALQYVEAVGDDLNIEGVQPFTKAAGAGPDDLVIFAWIVYESRERRDEVNALVMKDPRISCMGPDQMPFDCSKMFYGGFKTIAEVEKEEAL